MLCLSPPCLDERAWRANLALVSAPIRLAGRLCAPARALGLLHHQHHPHQQSDENIVVLALGFHAAISSHTEIESWLWGRCAALSATKQAICNYNHTTYAIIVLTLKPSFLLVIFSDWMTNSSTHSVWWEGNLCKTACLYSPGRGSRVIALKSARQVRQYGIGVSKGSPRWRKRLGNRQVVL
jgi:hypothetical protein